MGGYQQIRFLNKFFLPISVLIVFEVEFIEDNSLNAIAAVMACMDGFGAILIYLLSLSVIAQWAKNG